MPVAAAEKRAPARSGDTAESGNDTPGAGRDNGRTGLRVRAETGEPVPGAYSTHTVP